jgi:hypothetical protein
MRLIAHNDVAVHVCLSRSDVLLLLNMLDHGDKPPQERVLTRNEPEYTLIVRVEENDEHYAPKEQAYREGVQRRLEQHDAAEGVYDNA